MRASLSGKKGLYIMSRNENTPKLGRGLSALLGESVSSRGETVTIKSDRVSDIMVDYIKPGKYQPRQHFDVTEIENLASSIRENGLLQPILVRRVSDNDYELIAGERRWRAMKSLGFSTIQAIIKDFSEKESLSVALVENIQRENLSPIEESRAIDRLIVSLGHTQEEVGYSIGKSRSYVTNALRLLQLPEFVMGALEENLISVGHARALLGLDEELAREILTEINKKKLNVRQVELLVRSKKGVSRQKRSPRGSVSLENPISKQDLDADTLSLKTHIQDKLGVVVTINLSNGVGDIILKIPDLETLDSFMAKVSKI